LVALCNCGKTDEVAAGYQNVGWRADDGVIQALSFIDKPMDLDAVTSAIRSVYLPWAEESARHLQKVWEHGVHGKIKAKAESVKVDCILFVDGLRFDCCNRLVAMLVCQYDVVCFDEVSGISFDKQDGVNIMKGYMESGEFSRGKESIRADGSIVMVGNFDVDVEHQQRIGHLFGPMPPEMRDDTAFMDRIQSFLPGWDVPKINKELLTDHFGLVSDFLSECWSRLRNQSRISVLQNRVFFGGALSGRDTNAVNKTVSGLIKLLYPIGGVDIPDADLEWAVRLAMEARRRVKEQQKRIGAAEYRNTYFSYVMGADGVEKFVSTPELQSENSIGGDPLEPGQVM
jgi:predicted ATP-dependent Lon-type protease